MKKRLKWILIIVGSGLLLFIGYVFYVFSAFSFDEGGHYSKQDLIDNYKRKSNQIFDLKNYVNKIVPVGKTVDIEFDGDRKFFI